MIISPSVATTRVLHRICLDGATIQRKKPPKRGTGEQIRSVRNVNKDDAHSMQDDTISRQAAIDAVKGRFSMPVDNLIVEVIGALPSAEVEPIVVKRRR